MIMHGLKNPKSPLSLILLFSFPTALPSHQTSFKRRTSGHCPKLLRMKKFQALYIGNKCTVSKYPLHFLWIFSLLLRPVNIKPKSTGNGFTEKRDIITTPVKE
jgi:hypothetical protein